MVFIPRFFLPTGSDPLPDQATYAHAHPILTVGTSLLLLQTFALPGGAFLNSPTWSISTEVFFYLLLPFLIPQIAKIRTQNLFPAIVVLFLLGGVGPFLYHGHIFSEGLSKLGVTYTSALDYYLNQFVRMGFLTRIPEFLTGVLSFRLYREVLNQSHLKWIYIVGIAASLPFLWAMFLEGNENVENTVLYSGQFTSIPFFLMIILGLITSKAKPLNLFKTSFMVLLGEASFSLYLFHIPIKHFGQYILARLLHIDKGNVWLSLGLIGFSILLSIPIFTMLETPTRKKLTAWWKQRHTAPQPQS